MKKVIVSVEVDQDDGAPLKAWASIEVNDLNTMLQVENLNHSVITALALDAFNRCAAYEYQNNKPEVIDREAR